MKRNSISRRNENAKKTSSSLAHLLDNKEESRNEGNLIKLWKTATKDNTKREKRYYPSDYLHFDRSERKKNVRLNMKVFENLHEKVLMSSLGTKVAKPEFPKSLYSKTRIHLPKKRKRPGTAVLSRKKRNYTAEKGVSMTKLKSMMNDYSDVRPTTQCNFSRHIKSYDKCRFPTK
jgi:hypothetical protein